MKRTQLFLLSLFLTLPLLAQTPAPEIHSVQPSAGTVQGGTFVTVTGINLGVPPNFACVAPCPAIVRFGEVEVPAIQEENTFVTVRTPPHAAGTVDVTVRTG
ncbi:MAG TPA: IPT/TIG domain-containing protein, partial [Thermoanaerobaculia bacterium]|nr:IPT/TIG domain-containing protein [Thermoanaerobaculia bacterium]